MEAAVEVVGAVKRYRATTALDGVSLVARAGEVTALLGPNGAGKTTLVESAVGLRRLDAGACGCSAPTRRRRRPTTARRSG